MVPLSSPPTRSKLQDAYDRALTHHVVLVMPTLWGS